MARVRIHVADLGRADDLVLGVTLLDFAKLRDVARAGPLPGTRVAEADAVTRFEISLRSLCEA